MRGFIKLSSTLFLFSVSSQAFTLHDGFKYVLNNDMDSKVNENNLKSINIDKDIADSLYYPTLDFAATAQSTKLTQDKKTPDGGHRTKSDEYKFTLTQPIFDGLESKYEKLVQEERYKSALYNLKYSQNQIAFEYVQSYINVLREKDLLNLRKEALTSNEEIFNKVYKKVNSGYGTKLEFDQAKGNFTESKVNLSTQKINLREAIESLRFYVQKEFDTSELLKPSFYTPLPKNLNEAVDYSLKNNPAINISKANLKVATMQFKQTNKEFYPTLDLVGTYRLDNAFHTEDNSEYNEYEVGLQLNYNLYNGGRDSLNKRKALQTIKEKDYLIKKSEFQVKNETRLAWNSFILNGEKNDKLKQHLKAKKDIVDSTMKEFDLGLQTLNSYMDNQIEYIDIKRDYISNSYDLLLAKYRLLSSLGLLADALQNNLPTLEPTKIITDDLIIETEPKDGLKKEREEVQVPKVDFKKEYKNNVDKNTGFLIQNLSVPEIEYKQVIIDTNFKDKFLSASKDKYTINLAVSGSKKRSQKLLDKYDLNDNAFFFSFRYENPLQKIVMGVYDSKKEAKEALASLPNDLKKNKPLIEKISKKQKLFYKYNSSDIKIAKVELSKKKVETKKSEKKQKDDLNFEQRFLSASKDKYTINLAVSDSKKRSQKLLDRYDLNDNAFFFSFRYKNPLQKIMMGVYDSKKEAQKALASLPKGLKRNKPRIEKISKKQKLFYKYNNTNIKLANLERM